MEYTAGELRGRGITSDALQTTLEAHGYKELSDIITEGHNFTDYVEHEVDGKRTKKRRAVGVDLIQKKATAIEDYDLAVSLFAKELITRGNHDAVIMHMSDFWDIMEGDEYYDYTPARYTVLTNFQTEGPSPYVGKDGIKLRTRIERTIMNAAKQGKAFSIATKHTILKCDWYTEDFRLYMTAKTIRYEV